jgi:energy-coupling factor transporter ATP-binding protein EcfA2
MSILTATVRQVATIITANALAGIGTLIFGQPGVGKTTLIRQVHGKLRKKFTGGVYVLSTTEYNAIDLGGLYRVNENGRTERCPMEGLVNDKPILVLIDEFGDCDKFEQSGWYRLALERTIGEYRLHADSVVCAATNRPEDNAAANEISSAFKGRFCCVTMEADSDTLLSYGYANNWDSKLLAYLRAYGSQAVNSGFDPDSPYAGCTPRDFERLNKLETNKLISTDDEIARLQIVGCIDHVHGEKYAAFRKLEVPDPALVFADPKTAPIPNSVDKQFLYGAAVIGACEEKPDHFSKLVSYCLRNETVIGYGLFWDLCKRHPSFQSTPHFAQGAIEYQALPV